MSSLMGGVFGADPAGRVASRSCARSCCIIGSPELLAFAVLGISMVAVLSGNAPLRGLTAGCVGIMLAMIGSDPQTGTLRWTFDSLYLWDGLPLTPMVLGVFALPELCDLLISRQPSRQAARSTSIYKGHVAGREGLLPPLVADPALLVDRRRHRRDSRASARGDRLAGLWPRAEDGEGRAADLRQGRRARRHRLGKRQQRARKAARWCRPSPSACPAAPAWRSCSAPS